MTLSYYSPLCKIYPMRNSKKKKKKRARIRELTVTYPLWQKSVMKTATKQRRHTCCGIDRGFPVDVLSQGQIRIVFEQFQSNLCMLILMFNKLVEIIKLAHQIEKG